MGRMLCMETWEKFRKTNKVIGSWETWLVGNRVSAGSPVVTFDGRLVGQSTAVFPVMVELEWHMPSPYSMQSLRISTRSICVPRLRELLEKGNFLKLTQINRVNIFSVGSPCSSHYIITRAICIIMCRTGVRYCAAIEQTNDWLRWIYCIDSTVRLILWYSRHILRRQIQ